MAQVFLKIFTYDLVGGKPDYLSVVNDFELVSVTGRSFRLVFCVSIIFANYFGSLC